MCSIFIRGLTNGKYLEAGFLNFNRLLKVLLLQLYAHEVVQESNFKRSALINLGQARDGEDLKNKNKIKYGKRSNKYESNKYDSY